MALIVIYLIACLGVAWVFGNKAPGFTGGFLLSLFLTPFLAFIISLLYPVIKKENTVIAPKPEISLADELNKIKNYRDEGTITEDEFQILKKKILA